MVELFTTDDDYDRLRRKYIKNPIDVVHRLLSSGEFDLFRRLSHEFELMAVPDLHLVVFQLRSVAVLKVWLGCSLALPSDALRHAFHESSIEMVEYLLSIGYTFDEITPYDLIGRGGRDGIEVVKWAVRRWGRRRCLSYESVMRAIELFDLDLLQWLHDEYRLGPPIGPHYAVKWERYFDSGDRSSPYPVALERFIMDGDIDRVEQYYRLFALPINAKTSVVYIIASCNHPALIQWFIDVYPVIRQRQHRYPSYEVDRIRREMASMLLDECGRINNVDVVDYLLQYVEPTESVVKSAVSSVVSFDNVELLEYFFEKSLIGPELGTIHQLTQWINDEWTLPRRHFRIAQWFYRVHGLHGFAPTQHDLIDALTDTNFEYAQWLHQTFGLTIDGWNPLRPALGQGRHELVLWACDTFKIPINPVLRELFESDFVEPRQEFYSLTEPFDTDELVSRGQLITLRWLQETHPSEFVRLEPPSSRAIAFARKRHYCRTLEFVREVWSSVNE